MKRCFLPVTLVLAAACAVAAQSPAPHSARAQAAELLADAAGRSSALGQAEAVPVKIGGQIQFRYLWNHRQDEASVLSEDDTIGFQLRRTKLYVEGRVSDTFGYLIRGAFDRATGTFGLDDAYGTFDLKNGWALQWGQFKLPFLREENIGDSNQLAVENSIVMSEFTQDRSQAIQAAYEADSWRFKGAFSDGLVSKNTDFTAEKADYALTGRVDVKLAGDWKQFKDFTSWRGSPFAALAGGALHWESGGETFGTTDRDVASATADLSLEGDGWNAFGAVVWRGIDPAAGERFDDYGVVLQGGFFVAERAELFARYDVLIPDGDHPGDDPFNTVTLGFNRYFLPESHSGKFTADLMYFLDDPSKTSIAPITTSTGLLPDTGDGQFVVRAQMQILF
jgi:phosphate-selective porin OprO and OprP